MNKDIVVPDWVFSENVLNKDYHERLLASLYEFTRTANIQPKYVWAKLVDYCVGEDFDWVKGIKHSDDSGMAYIGKSSTIPIEDKMAAIAGCLLRNYIDARVMTLQSVVDHLADGTMPQPTVLLIPNFYLSANNGGKVATWEVSSLLGLLYERMAANLKTVVYISNHDEMTKDYGSSFSDHILNHYSIVNL